MMEHFREEETVLMPMMRKVVTHKEYNKEIVTPIVRSLTPLDNGTFMRIMSPEDMSGFFKQEGIPFFIGWLLKYFVRKYNRTVLEPFQRAVAKAEAVKATSAAAA